MFWAIFALIAALSGCGGKQRPMKAVPRPIGWTETGIASWYGPPYHGRRAASGEVYDMEKLTAAHKTLPFNTWVRVENQSTGKQAEVRITDRGPFVRGRIIDLSRAGARDIGMLNSGVAKVKITVIRPPRRAPEPVEPQPRPVLPPVEEKSPAEQPPSVFSDPPAAVQSFGVQIAVVSNWENAERLRQAMEKRFGSAKVVEREGERPMWRVIVGAVDNERSAGVLLDQLRAEYRDAFVVRID